MKRLILLSAVFLGCHSPAYCATTVPPAAAGLSARTVLGVDGTRFTLNRKPAFLLGFSYYGGLGAPDDFIRRDLEDFRKRGFNWLRVWATWASGEADVSAVDARGGPREPYLDRLKALVAECERLGLVVDVTLSRGKPRLPDFAAHERAVETLTRALKPYRNWYLDLANERDVRDDRYVPAKELKALREQVRRLDPERLVTASFGGDVDGKGIGEALVGVGLDFLCPHRPRDADSARETATKTRAVLAISLQLGHPVPVHYQEPFRRGYTQWQPSVQDFLRDLRGALQGGAAGWCFHNGQERDTPDHQPQRSFDLRKKRLFDQLDGEEREFVEQAQALLSKP